MQDAIAYKVLLPGEWATLMRDGRFAGAPVDLADGFIHMSTAAQLDETLRKHFAGMEDLQIAAIDLTARPPGALGTVARRRAVSASLRRAAARGGGRAQPAGAAGGWHRAASRLKS